MGTDELFQNADVSQLVSGGDAASLPEDERIVVAAHRLAVQLTDDSYLPARYRRRFDPSHKKQKVKEASEVEKQFKVSVQSWRQLIETMLTKIDGDQAWRFIDLFPQIDGPLNMVTECKDFCDFIDYMILRRDKEHCGNAELGGLAQLSVAFQRQIEKQIPKP